MNLGWSRMCKNGPIRSNSMLYWLYPKNIIAGSNGNANFYFKGANKRFEFTENTVATISYKSTEDKERKSYENLENIYYSKNGKNLLDESNIQQNCNGAFSGSHGISCRKNQTSNEIKCYQNEHCSTISEIATEENEISKTELFVTKGYGVLEEEKESEHNNYFIFEDHFFSYFPSSLKVKTEKYNAGIIYSLEDNKHIVQQCATDFTGCSLSSTLDFTSNGISTTFYKSKNNIREVKTLNNANPGFTKEDLAMVLKYNNSNDPNEHPVIKIDILKNHVPLNQECVTVGYSGSNFHGIKYKIDAESKRIFVDYYDSPNCSSSVLKEDLSLNEYYIMIGFDEFYEEMYFDYIRADGLIPYPEDLFSGLIPILITVSIVIVVVIIIVILLFLLICCCCLARKRVMFKIYPWRSSKSNDTELELTPKQKVALLREQDLNELKYLNNPPETIKSTIHATVLLLVPFGIAQRLKTQKKKKEEEFKIEYTWKELRTKIFDVNFERDMENFDFAKVEDEVVKKVRSLMKEITVENAYEASKACGPLAQWILSEITD